MSIVKGDLIRLALEKHFDVIVHGCNCFCTMGAGIAKAIRNEFPEAYKEDCKTKKGSKDKLGDYSSATVIKKGHEITIINGYIQYHYKGQAIKVNYEAVRLIFKKIKTNYSGKKIGYPKIGAGLAGGDWNIISKIINDELEDEDHTLVEYVQEKS